MYESFYGLRHKPFQITVDSRFFFPSRVHYRAMTYLRYGLQCGEGFIVMTGAAGTGKSVLASKLLESVRESRLECAHIVASHMQTPELARMVAAAFEVPHVRIGRTKMLRELRHYLSILRREERRGLLIIDEAQALNRGALEELVSLSSLAENGEALLQVLLLGQPELIDVVRAEGFERLRQRIITAHRLEPIEADEVGAYIEHRLKLAGWSPGKPSFEPSVFPAIHALSAGVPRQINTLCDRLLLCGYLNGKMALDEKDVATIAGEVLAERGLGVEATDSPRKPTEKAAKPSRTTRRKQPADSDSYIDAVHGLRAELASLREAFQGIAGERKPDLKDV